MTEFELIYQLINTQSLVRPDVLTGIGDDCAILSVPVGHSLAVSMDTLVEDVHFPKNTSAFSIGYKSLAVNLSDLAATGAEPAWITLSLTLPRADESWIKEFVKGLFALANKHNVQLVGGDTTRGALSVSIQAHGFVKNALLRSGAKVGDLIYVSGCLGDAALGLRYYSDQEKVNEKCIHKLQRPEPRVKLGQALSSIATSCIDISDGLVSDLGHICKQSQCGAEININDIPVSEEYIAYFNNVIDYKDAISFGDDYELCFTVSPHDKNKINKISESCDLSLTCVGVVTDTGVVKYLDKDKNIINSNIKGFEHFK